MQDDNKKRMGNKYKSTSIGNKDDNDILNCKWVFLKITRIGWVLCFGIDRLHCSDRRVDQPDSSLPFCQPFVSMSASNW